MRIRRGPPHAFLERVNVAGTQLVPMLLSAPRASFKFGAPHPATGELGVFLSSLAGLFDQSPEVSPAPAEAAGPPALSHSTGIRVASRDQSTDSRREVNKDTKGNNKEEPAARLQFARPVQDVRPVIVMQAVSGELPTPRPEPVEGTSQIQLFGNGSDAGSVPLPNLVRQPEPARPELRVVARPGEVAFALRLTPKPPATESASQVVAPTAQSETSAGSIRHAETVQANPHRMATLDVSIRPATESAPQGVSPVAQSGKPAVSIRQLETVQANPYRMATTDVPIRPATPRMIADRTTSLPAPEEHTARPAQIRNEPDFKPAQIAALWRSTQPAAPIREIAPVERTPAAPFDAPWRSPQPAVPIKEIVPEQTPVAPSSAAAAPVSSVASTPNAVEAPFTPFWPVWLKQNPERVAAASSDTLAMPDRQPQPEPLAAVAETPLSDYPSPAPDLMAKTRALPVSPRRASQPIPFRESEISQPAARETKAPSTAQPDMPAPHVAVRQVEGNVMVLEAPARVPRETGPDIRIGSNAVPSSSALKVMPEPEIKVAIAPPPTRQISLKLSGDDSTRVNIDLTERAGKVQVSVRTPDHELAKSLQTDLGDLVGRLESKGFKAETWVPAAAHSLASAPQASNSSTTPHGQREYSGSWSGGGGRQSQNGSNQRRQSHWAAELDETVSASQARSENE